MKRNSDRFLARTKGWQLAHVAVGVLGTAFLAMPANAQSPVPEYNRLLSTRCAAMGFARDSGGQLLPGQATGIVQSYCGYVPTAAEPPVGTFNSGWGNPFFLTGPHFIERTSAMPGWRDRLVHHYQGSGARRRGDPPKQSESNWGPFGGIKFGAEHIDSNDYEESVDQLNSALVVGVNYVLVDSLLLSVTGAWRERGYDAGVSFAWAPTERFFAEILFTYDYSEQNVPDGDFIIDDSYDTRMGDSYYYPSQTTSHPSMEFKGVEFYAGYDWHFANWLIGPRAGAEYREGRQASYTEQIDTYDTTITEKTLPTALTFDGATEESLTHRLGVSFAYVPVSKFVMPPEIELAWVHQYRDLERMVIAHFAEDIRPDPAQVVFRSGGRSRDVGAGRVAFGFHLAPRFDFVATGEVRYDAQYGYELNSMLGVRGKL